MSKAKLVNKGVEGKDAEPIQGWKRSIFGESLERFLSCVRVWASCVYFDPDMII